MSDPPTIQEVIVELKEREEKATERPWLIDEDVFGRILHENYVVVNLVGGELDAALIVGMRNQLPELLVYVAKLESHVAILQGELALHPDGACGCAGEGRCQWCRLTDLKMLVSEALTLLPEGKMREALREAIGE